MHRFSIAACTAAAVCCLAGGAGCCCCQPGFSLRGDWSLEMDRLPNVCGHSGCGHGNCVHGHPDEAGAHHAERDGYYTPQFHPVPTGPVGNVAVPHVKADSHVASAQGPKQVSVLKREPAPASGTSSWMFVRRQGPANASPEAAQRRQLGAEGWTTARRR